jgi:hypothetical protein
MRMTVDLPDELFHKLKTVAVQRGISLKELLRTAVEHELGLAQRPAEWFCRSYSKEHSRNSLISLPAHHESYLS